MFRPLLLVVLLCIPFGTSVVCAGDGKGFDESELTTFLVSQMRAFHLPGAAVGIVHHGQIVYLHGFGTADRAGHPITPQSLFLIGSSSKSITALALMQLVDIGKLQLDAPVQQYLPWFRLKDAEASKTITVRNLLNHTSGLPYLDPIPSPASPDLKIASEQYAAGLRKVALVHPVGQAFEYSDLNYEILGMLLETVTHQSFAAYVTGHVLDPLEMHATFLTYEDATTHGLVDGYQYLFGLLRVIPTPRYGAHGVGAGEIASTAEDMCHYLIAELQGGVYNGRAVISPASLALMNQPRTDIGSTYGMGWFIESWNGLKSINHMGMNENFSSMVNILPEQGYGVVILMNVNSFSIMGQTNNLMDGVIRRLAGQEKVAYWPEELMQRLFLLAMLLAGTAQLIRRLRHWHKLQYSLSLRMTPKVAVTLAFGLIMVVIYLVIIPIYATSPLEELFDLQPDIGYGLVAGAILSILNAMTNAFVTSA